MGKEKLILNLELENDKYTSNLMKPGNFGLCVTGNLGAI